MENLYDRFSNVSQDLDSYFEFIVVKRTAEGYGFEVQSKDALIGNSENSFVVECLKDVNKGNTTNRLMTGDEILSFNGISIRQLTRSHIEKTLRSGKNDIKLIIRRFPPKVLPEMQPDYGYHSYENLAFNMPAELSLPPRTKEHRISHSEVKSVDGSTRIQWTIKL